MPTKELMLNDHQDLVAQKRRMYQIEKCISYHLKKIVLYFEQLENMAELAPLQPVIFKLTKRVFDLFNDVLQLFDC